jgi:hypothetical protein
MSNAIILIIVRLAAASDKVYQLLAQGRWFSPDTPASSTTKTGRHDIAEILLKVALNTKNSNSISNSNNCNNGISFMSYSIILIIVTIVYLLCLIQ